jgi:hypothetical protein
LAVAALLTQEASELTFGKPTTVLSPHWLTDLLSHHCLSNLSPSRLQLFHLTFLENPDVTLQAYPPLNPATLLPDVKPLEHSCLESLETLIYCQPHLSSSPLPNPDICWFIDGSSSLDSIGRRQAGYATVSLTNVIESNPLPWGTTFQKAELIALSRALTLAEGKTANIFTESKYAYPPSCCSLGGKGLSYHKGHTHHQWVSNS